MEDEDVALLYHNMDNGMTYKQEEPQSVEMPGVC
jgi:hypothetical protein